MDFTCIGITTYFAHLLHLPRCNKVEAMKSKSLWQLGVLLKLLKLTDLHDDD